MRRLDIHVHFNSGDKDEIEKLVATCRDLNTVAVMSGGLRYGGHDFLPNEEVISWCKRYPDWLVPFAKLDLWETASADEVYRYAELGAKGFKCIYPYYEYDHDLYMPVYEAAEACGLPILFHTGNYRPSEADTIYRRPMLKNMNPINLDRIARSFQKLHLVMAHLGTRIFQDEAVQYLKMLPNLYGDMGGYGQWRRLQPAELTEMLTPDGVCVDPSMKNFRKLVLGSDAYVTVPQTMRDGQKYYDMLLSRIGVPKEIQDEIMGRTVAGWLGIELD